MPVVHSGALAIILLQYFQDCFRNCKDIMKIEIKPK